MKIGIIVRECYDGSAALNFYKDIDKARWLLGFGKSTYLSDDVEVLDVQENFEPPGGWSD
uniref:Uncharacterized protein n=1 Tax=Escherichia phage 1-6af TaxID=3117707 RepID=A0AAU6NV44_9CAUD